MSFSLIVFALCTRSDQSLRGNTFKVGRQQYVNTAAVAPTLNFDVLNVLSNFYVNLSLSGCKGFADSCDECLYKVIVFLFLIRLFKIVRLITM